MAICRALNPLQHLGEMSHVIFQKSPIIQQIRHIERSRNQQPMNNTAAKVFISELIKYFDDKNGTKLSAYNCANFIPRSLIENAIP